MGCKPPKPEISSPTGICTGFSQDPSTGVLFGLKFPTRVYTVSGLDRDTQIGWNDLVETNIPMLRAVNGVSRVAPFGA